jgi:hypothetical protein
MIILYDPKNCVENERWYGVMVSMYRCGRASEHIATPIRSRFDSGYRQKFGCSTLSLHEFCFAFLGCSGSGNGKVFFAEIFRLAKRIYCLSGGKFETMPHVAPYVRLSSSWKKYRHLVDGHNDRVAAMFLENVLT